MSTLIFSAEKRLPGTRDARIAAAVARIFFFIARDLL